MSKQRLKLKKSRSHDVTSTTCDRESSSAEDSPKVVLRREEFICSDGHNAHLEEDYLKDESKLFGRQIGSPRSQGRRAIKTVASESSIRRFFKSKSVDTHSLKTAASSSPTVSRNEEEVRSTNDEIDDRNALETCNAVDKLSNVVDDVCNVDKNETERVEPKFLPRKPPRKRESSLTGNGVNRLVRRGSIRLRRSSATNPPSNTFVNNSVVRNGSVTHNATKVDSFDEEEVARTSEVGVVCLNRRDSFARPLHCDMSCGFGRPRLYSRNSLTHDNQFALENEEIERNLNGDIVSPDRPERSRHSSFNLVKRESLIHPQRPPRRRTPLGTTNLYQPLIVNGRFQNPWSTWKRPSFVGSLRWSLLSKDNSSVPNSVEELDKQLPVIPLVPESISQPPLNGIRVTWLGHSTVLIQFNDISILTDPMFSERAFPVGFMGPKRIRSFPGSVYDLPKLDAVVISHNHYDHLDYNSVLLLNARFGSELHWFVPVGLRTWMHNAGCESVTELTWWAEGSLRQASEVAFVFTPAQHWSKRTPTDDNKVLWGSWCIMGPRYRFFFAGDTGYCDAFKQIGDQFGPFDLAAIPIGAYEPRWFMHNQHIDPTEAVKIHQDIRSKKSFGIHWGTFILTNEHYLEPPKKLAEATRQVGLSNNDFFVLKHGESKLIYGT